MCLINEFTIEEIQGDNYFRGENPAYGASITYYLNEGTIFDSVDITIKDKDGNVVRNFTGPGNVGLNTAHWDLMSDEGAADKLLPPVRRLSYEDRHFRRLVSTGDYTVEIKGQSKPVHVRPQPVGAINPTGRIN